MASDKHMESWQFFKQIDWLPNYAFGRDGSVYSCLKPGGNGRIGKWRRLTPPTNKHGYRVLSATVSGEIKHIKIHRLILEAFVGPAPDGLIACHNDGDRLNNALSNLRWDTQSSNRRDAYRHGTAPIGSQRKTSKLTEDQVRDIKVRLAAGESTRSVSADYGVSSAAIHHIKAGRAWRHVAV